jgi:hypothetical protein
LGGSETGGEAPASGPGRAHGKKQASGFGPGRAQAAEDAGRARAVL